VEFNDGVVVEEEVVAAGCEEVDQFAPRLVFGDGGGGGSGGCGSSRHGAIR